MKKVEYEFREPKTGGPGRKRVKRGEKEIRRIRVEKNERSNREGSSGNRLFKKGGTVKT